MNQVATSNLTSVGQWPCILLLTTPIIILIKITQSNINNRNNSNDNNDDEEEEKSVNCTKPAWNGKEKKRKKKASLRHIRTKSMEYRLVFFFSFFLCLISHNRCSHFRSMVMSPFDSIWGHCGGGHTRSARVFAIVSKRVCRTLRQKDALFVCLFGLVSFEKRAGLSITEHSSAIAYNSVGVALCVKCLRSIL